MRQRTLSRAQVVLIVCLILLGTGCHARQRELTEKREPSTVITAAPSSIETMAWQGDSILWTGDRHGVRRWDRRDRSVDEFDDVECIHLLVSGDQEGVWCSGFANAYRFDGGVWHRYELDAYLIVEAVDGTLWAGTTHGLSRFDPEGNQWLPVLDAREVASHFVFSGGPGIHASFVSRDNALWFFSFSEPYVGTTRWTESGYQTWQPAGKWAIVAPRLQARDGSVWGIGDDSVVARWDGSRWQTWQPFRLRPGIVDILEAADGRIWVLAAADGVGRWDGVGWVIWARDEAILLECPGLPEGRECFSVSPNTEYYSGIGLGKSTASQSRLALTDLQETQDGDIWVATAQEGVSRWDGHRWRNYTIDDGLSSEAITVLTESPDGVLWIATRSGEICYFDSEADRFYSFP